MFAEKNLAHLNITNLCCELNEKQNLDLAQMKTYNKCLSGFYSSCSKACLAHTIAQVQNKKDDIKVFQTSKTDPEFSSSVIIFLAVL
jgi:hypothetical protein